MKLLVFFAALALVTVMGLGFYVTDFTAYLGNNPSTCNNCHVMDTVYEGWFHGAHRAAADCNDCHTPHSLVPKYFVKAQSGYHHVSAFLLGNIPDAIRAKHASKTVIQENCTRCHLETVESVSVGGMDPERYCFECHRSVAHGERGITTSPLSQEIEEKP